MKFDWKLTTVVYTRAQAFPAATTHDSRGATRTCIHVHARTRYYGKREGESRGIIGQNNGQPFRDNDELALRFAYAYTCIMATSSSFPSVRRSFCRSNSEIREISARKQIVGDVCNSAMADRTMETTMVSSQASNAKDIRLTAEL